MQLPLALAAMLDAKVAEPVAGCWSGRAEAEGKELACAVERHRIGGPGVVYGGRAELASAKPLAGLAPAPPTVRLPLAGFDYHAAAGQGCRALPGQSRPQCRGRPRLAVGRPATATSSVPV